MYFKYYEPFLNEWCLTKMPYLKGIITRFLKKVNPNAYTWVEYVPKRQVKVRK